MKRTRILPAAAIVSCLSVANAMAFNQMRSAGADMGRASAFAENSQVTVTVALNLSNRDELEKLVQSLYTRGNSSYHQFLSPQQFRQRFGPSAEGVAPGSRGIRNLATARYVDVFMEAIRWDDAVKLYDRYSRET